MSFFVPRLKVGDFTSWPAEEFKKKTRVSGRAFNKGNKSKLDVFETLSVQARRHVLKTGPLFRQFF